MDCLVAHVTQIWDRQRDDSPIYSILLGHMQIHHAEPGVIHARLEVQKQHLNSKGTLHGTLSACLVDCAADLAIVSHGSDYTGVSTDLSVSYLSTAKEGDVLEIEGKAGKVGRTMAFTTVTVSKEVDGKRSIVVQGSHTKYVKR